ncbi:G-type lectin S-receptor serine/threonine-protein kinase SD1-1 [Spatholobus suberectus]|nr:G-type lectin S-receptor serine/threonine-protein kinase SD1-1 [Spatholobus suberectus]
MDMFVTLTLISFHLLFPSTVAETLLQRMVLETTENQDVPARGIKDDSYCSYHRVCGANGNCDLTRAPACVCLEGFTPKSLSGWDSMDYTQGCVRNKALNCTTDDFVKYGVFQEPSGTYIWLNQSLGDGGCKERCMRNCSCVAYTTDSGCKLWTGHLFDVRVIKGGEQDFYIRMPASELGTEEENSRHGERKIVGGIIGSTAAIISAMIICCCYYMHRRRTKLEGNIRTTETVSHINEEHKEDMELPVFDLSRIAIATDNFSVNNKLGEGGFGPVYKGTLDDGRQIAVKRLSSSSGQGLNELKNEVILIAKLQHRNLVRLLGCCIQNQEKLLIYEYMPNRSLDYFIFDERRGKILDWPKRFNIICGIARGLLYLHQDSRLRIIHRDLKAGNVLLDSEMNPKISDFGLAKSFGGDQSKGNTNRVVGTYGYMAPEYAVNGHFSVKSDVFSFGILLLEIITGRKSRRFYYPDDNINLFGHAWDLWEQGRPLELIDECLNDSWILSEVQRCIHISLLCAQQHPQDRPSMSTVVLMLGSEIDLPQPKIPTFFIGEPSDGISCSCSKNELSVTVLDAR